MLNRALESIILKRAQKMPVVAILGPRQSGKTTLAKSIFKEHFYVSLENYEERELALTDPKRFLATHISSPFGIIIDEVQHAPQLLSYIQTMVDQEHKPGFIIMTGSQNILVNKAISQSLAGRVALFTLLPFSIAELKENSLLAHTLEEAVFKGYYPRVFAYDLEPTPWYLDYIETFVERDVRLVGHILDLVTFRRFMRLCAGRVGQLLNIASLATDCGVDQRTVKSWLSVLEASYIIFRLEPHFENFNKRLIKSPKLYFYDTGLVCALLGIKSPQQVQDHYLRGGLVESMIMSEIFKYHFNHGERPQNVFFWKNQSGQEIDCLIQKNNKWVPIEIKASTTIVNDFFKTLSYWKNLTQDSSGGYVVYGGEKNQDWPQGLVISWKNTEEIFCEND